MKKATFSWLSGAVAAVAVLWLLVEPANALKNFRDEFVAKYVKPDSKDPKDKAFAEAVEKAKCYVCHEGKSKKNRNPYGTALSVLLDKKKDKDNKEKIRQSLDIVATIKSNPADPKSPTFGELIQQGKLPGGEPKPDAGEKKVAASQ